MLIFSTWIRFYAKISYNLNDLIQKWKTFTIQNYCILRTISIYTPFYVYEHYKRSLFRALKWSGISNEIRKCNFCTFVSIILAWEIVIICEYMVCSKIGSRKMRAFLCSKTHFFLCFHSTKFDNSTVTI